VHRAELFIAAPYDAVWSALTHASRFEAWYAAPCLAFGASAGDGIEWGTRERVVQRGTLRSLLPGEGLAFSFEFVGFGIEEPTSEVDVRIEPRGPAVYVGVRHDCVGAPRTAELISETGWTKLLSRLKTYCETGEPMPWPEDPTS